MGRLDFHQRKGTPDGDAHEYAYDALGARHEARLNGETISFLNDPSGIGWVFAERGVGAESPVHQILGLRLAARVNATGEWFYYGFDRSGHTRLVPDPVPVLDPSIWELAHKPISELVAPGDPNEKDGWGSLGQRGVAGAGEELRYIIYFENDPKIASAPAQEVWVTDPLSSDLDWSSRSG